MRLRWLWEEDDRLTLADMIALTTEWLAHDPGSYTARAVLGDDWPWGMREQLLAELVDVTRLHLWAAFGQDGDRPPPIPRPGTEPEPQPEDEGIFGMAALQGFDPAAALDPREWLAW